MFKFNVKVSSWSFFLLITFMAVVLLQGLIFNWKPVDDAYISFRYAENLVNGHGLVFNPGERVEGYTNFLWTVLLAICGWVGLDIVWAGMWLGVMFACLAIVLTWMLARSIAMERDWPVWLIWIPPLLLACYPGWSYWAFSGMEPPMLACLVILFLFFGCNRPSTAGGLVLSAVFGILGALTRWEFVILWPAVVLVQVFCGSRPVSGRFIRAGILSLLLIAGFGCYFMWRFSYYGDLMPNTYYAKVGGNIFSRIPRGLVYTGELAVCWWLPVSLILWLTNCRFRNSNTLLSSILLYVAYVTWTGGDHFAWLRFYAPVLPLAAIMAAEVIKCLTAVAVWPKFRRLSCAVVLVGMLAVFLGTSMRIDYPAAQKHHVWVKWWRNVGLWSRDAFPSDYRFAIIPAGIIPYLSGHPILDLLGLTDREVAHYGEIDATEAPGHQKSNIVTVLNRKPEVILGEALGFDNPPTQKDVLHFTNRNMLRKLYQLPEFKEMYDYKVVEIGERYTSYWILKDLSD